MTLVSQRGRGVITDGSLPIVITPLLILYYYLIVKEGRFFMLKKKLIAVCFALSMCLSLPLTSAAEVQTANMESCGAYLFEWRPVDCGNGQYFAILVHGNAINESNVILKRGYDYAYTFEPSLYSRPWGNVPALVNVDGLWGIPENWPSMPEGSQPVTQIVLKTNNKKMDTDKRYVNVVYLPSNISTDSLPPEVRKYLINVDGTDSGAYEGTDYSGWVTDESGQWRYRKPDGTFVGNGWLNVDDKQYYMDENGVMVTDTITPDGIYVNAKGEKTNYIPGWLQTELGWKYVLKDGYFAASTWFQDTDGKWYYFDMGGYMKADCDTPDGYHLDANGVWDGQGLSEANQKKLGPGAVQTEETKTEETQADSPVAEETSA